MMYASCSRSLVCLETLVHLARSPLPLNRYLVELTVPQAQLLAATDFGAALNIGWDAQPAGNVSLDWGTRWAQGMSSLLARVPSIIVEEEFNVIINPRHAESASLRARKVRKWRYAAVSERNVQYFRVLKRLLHAGADRVVVVLRLDHGDGYASLKYRM